MTIRRTDEDPVVVRIEGLSGSSAGHQQQRASFPDLANGFVEVAEARGDWAHDPELPLPKFSPPRRVPRGVTLIGRPFDEGAVAQANLALERAFAIASQRLPGF